ncbi:MAG: hypothetical protein Tsb0014_04890 [Pleurocapsa sp.]
MSIDGKIQALNNAIRESIPSMQDAAADNPTVELLVRALTFSSGAQWHIQQPTPVDDFKWRDLSAGGITDMGEALSIVADELDMSVMSDRALPPVLVLISDGQPTDDYIGGLKKLLHQPWGQKAVRIAIGIGKDADMGVLQQFISKGVGEPLVANNAEALTRYIKWASTAVSSVSSVVTPNPNNTTQKLEQSENNHIEPPVVIPPTPTDGWEDDVW